MSFQKLHKDFLKSADAPVGPNPFAIIGNAPASSWNYGGAKPPAPAPAPMANKPVAPSMPAVPPPAPMSTMVAKASVSNAAIPVSVPSMTTASKPNYSVGQLLALLGKSKAPAIPVKSGAAPANASADPYQYSLPALAELIRTQRGLKKVPIDKKTRFADLGFDDLDHFDLALTAEEQFGLPNTRGNVNNLRPFFMNRDLFPTVGHMHNYILQKQRRIAPSLTYEANAHKYEPNVAPPITVKKAQGLGQPLNHNVPSGVTPPANSTGNWFDSAKNLGNQAWDATKGFVNNQIGNMGNQWDRAKATYGFNRYVGGNSPMQAGLKAFGNLDQSTRGIAGGGLGLIGAGMLSPRSMRGVTMPLATGAGAMFAAATGKDGFKWENMLKPDALMAGGLGLGAGYLGSKLLGTDDEEESDGYERRPASGGSSWLPTIGALGALGLGGYGLYRHFNGGGAAPDALNGPAVNVGTGAAANAAMAGANAAAVPARADVAPAQPVTNPVPPPVPPIPETPAAPVAPVAQAPVATPEPLSPGNRNFIDRPESVSAYAASKGHLPGPKENLGKLVSEYNQSEIPGLANQSKMPQLSNIYKFINEHPSHPASMMLGQRAQGYINALDSARQATTGQDWAGLDRLESLKVNPDAPASFGVGGLQSLGAFGFKDLSSMASAAAQGDPKVVTAIKSMDREEQLSLLKALTQPGFNDVNTSDGQQLSLPAVAANPRAAALYGAAQAAVGGESLRPEAYDPKAFLSPAEQLRERLTAGQKAQLLSDIRDPNAVAERFAGLSPEERTVAARNMGGLLSRNARGVFLPGETNPVEVPSWLDESAQKAIARVAGNNDYNPVNLQRWYDLSNRGQDSSASLSPYTANGKYRTQADMAQPVPEGYSPLDIVLNRSAETDENVMADWAKSLTSSMPKYKHLGGQMPSQDEAGPLALSLKRFAEVRPDLYDRLVEKLQQNASQSAGVPNRWGSTEGGTVNWRDYLAQMIDQPGLNPELGNVMDRAGRPYRAMDLPR